MVVKLSARLSRTGAQAVMRAIAWLALVVFALFAMGIHLWALLDIYPDPALNRIYAESLGIEAGPYIFGSLAVAVASAILAFAVARALRSQDPGNSAPLWLTCVIAPAAWVLIATTLDSVISRFKREFAAFGADLPTPTLVLLGFEGYWLLTAVLPLVLLCLAWAWRSKPALFRGVATAQLLALLLSSAFFAVALASFALPAIKMCGAV